MQPGDILPCLCCSLTGALAGLGTRKLSILPADFERLLFLTLTQMVKENMEKKFGGLWNVVSGKSFAYEVTHGVQDMLLLYLGSASVGMLIWRV